MRKSRIIDSHAHVVQYIAGTGAGGELRSIGNGMAVYANGQTVRFLNLWSPEAWCEWGGGP